MHGTLSVLLRRFFCLNGEKRCFGSGIFAATGIWKRDKEIIR